MKTKYVLKQDLVISAGTELKEWSDGFEAVIGIHKDGVAYFRSYKEDLDEQPSLFVKVVEPNRKRRTKP